MSIERTKPSGWGVGVKLTSGEIGAIDESLTYALDKRAGQIDPLMSHVIATGAGRITDSVATGPDSNTTLYRHQAGIVRVPTLMAPRAYTLAATGVTGGDRMLVYVQGTGSTPSGYVDVLNAQGTGLARLGMVAHSSPNHSAEAGAGEFLFDGSAWQLLRLGSHAGLRSIEFLASTTWTCPPGVHHVMLEGCGGGGGGGGATPAGTVNTESATGGAGGGGAQLRRRIVAVTPGTTYTITIGAGGAGGGASTAGSAGGDTSFGSLATFAGAGGGTSSSSSSSNAARATLGGLPVANVSANYNGRIAFPTNASDLVIPAAGAGGSGVNAIGGFTTGFNGNESVEGYAGGAGAASGATGATYYGGGGGGGGGGGPYGAGGAGGAGGDGPDLAGTNGTAAAANSGAGGGGGGGAGQWSTPTAAAGTGGAGGSGRLIVSYVR